MTCAGGESITSGGGGDGCVHVHRSVGDFRDWRRWRWRCWFGRERGKDSVVYGALPFVEGYRRIRLRPEEDRRIRERGMGY